MKIGGWKTESVFKYYIEATSSGNVHGSKRRRGQSYASASEFSLSPELGGGVSTACAQKD